MLKPNLVAIAIVVLGFGVTSIAFGQEQRRKSAHKTTVKKPASVRSEGGNPNSNLIGSPEFFDKVKNAPRSLSPSRDPHGSVSPNSNPHGIKSPRNISTGQASPKTQGSTSRIRPPQPKGMNKADLTEQLSIKSRRKQNQTNLKGRKRR